jgi:hypothetical protein
MKKVRNEARFRLTNAAERRKFTLGSVLMIRIPYQGQFILCDSHEEAIEVLKQLAAERKAEQEKRRTGLVAKFPLAEVFGPGQWTGELFWTFIESIGDSQRQALGLLVRKGRATDEEMRKILGVASNQALAGILSGISKQAASIDVPARSVYTVEDERKSGELTKTYAIAPDFLRIAKENNWTGEE